MPPHVHIDAYVKAAIELGYNATDFNSPNQIGVSPSQLTTDKGRRDDTGSAFVKPVLNRRNLKVIPNSYVIKIEIDKTKNLATKVVFINNGTEFVANAKKEIILSAGVFGTPQLLMLSGIGPKEHLTKLKIPVIQNLQVGSVLRDHTTYFGLVFSTNVTLTKKTLREDIKDYLNGVGEFTSFGPIDALGFFKTNLEPIANYPDVELLMLSLNPNGSYSRRLFGWEESIFNSVWGVPRSNGFQMNVINLHQKSIGSVRLKTASPYDYPLIDSNFLSDKDNHDIDVIYEGIQLTLKLVQTEAFKRIDTKLVANIIPPCKRFRPWSKKYWYCTIRYLTNNLYHPMGSCPMGPDPIKGAVVNHNLQVYGIENLRVADASVFPLTISGHNNAACIVIGEKLSDIIKHKYKYFNLTLSTMLSCLL